MKTLKICALAALTFFSNCFKYDEVPELNPNFEIFPESRSYNDAIQTRDGGYVVVGSLGTKILIEKFGRMGEPVWSNNELIPSGLGLATGIKENAQGDLILTARAENRGAIFKCNGENGDKIGEYNIDNLLNGYEYSTLEDLQILPNGNIAAIGTADAGSEHPFVFLVVKESGNDFQKVEGPQSVDPFGDAFVDTDTKMHLKTTPDGGFVIAATVAASGWAFSYGIIEKLNAKGVHEWHFSYKDHSSVANIYDVAVNEGKYYVIGDNPNNAEQKGIYLGCIDPSVRKEIWSLSFGERHNDNARGIALLPNGDLGVVGSKWNGSNSALTYFKVNTTTKTVTPTKYFNGNGDTYGDGGKSIFITKEGGVLFSGYTYNGSQRNGYLIKADENGNL